MVLAQNQWENFFDLATMPPDQIKLDRSALLIASLFDPKVNVDRELGNLDMMARVATRRVRSPDNHLTAINNLSEYLFDELGFTGNSNDYYDPSNSLLPEVLSSRSGIPITLSLIYIEIGRRLGIPLTGIGMPGHFLVGHRDITGLFIDPFNRGILLNEAECMERMMHVTDDINWDPKYLLPISHKEFISRMIRNLKVSLIATQDYSGALRMIDWLIKADPTIGHERLDRGLVNYHLERYDEALNDMRMYLSSERPYSNSKLAQEIINRLEPICE
mgnify:FL=1